MAREYARAGVDYEKIEPSSEVSRTISIGQKAGYQRHLLRWIYRRKRCCQ